MATIMPDAPTQQKTYGGVSATPRKGSLQGMGVGPQPTGPAPVSPAFPNFKYHGGPVISCAQVYTSFWGDQWLTDPASTQRAGRLGQFMKDFLASQYMNILSQYGCGGGAGSAGLFVRSGFVTGVPNSIDEATIHTTIQNLIDAGAVPEPTATGTKRATIALMIYLADGIGVDSANLGAVMCEPNGDTAFGYHYFFTTAAGHNFYYAVIPGLTNACLQQSCQSDAGCSLHLAETQEQRQTQVSSHEFSEMVSDPELTAWYDPGAGEIGDICNGEAATITVGADTWTVQRMYSFYDDVNSHGATICVVNPPSPIPELAGGPVSGVTPAAALRLVPPGSLDRLLPLPTFYHDIGSGATETKTEEMQAYVRRMFHPLTHADLVGNLPQFLSDIAATVQ